MPTRKLPTVLSSRSIGGTAPSTSRRNLAWNSDGQCLITSKQGITVATPYLASTLQAPSLPLDRTVHNALARERGKDEDSDGDEPVVVDLTVESARRLPRPKSGELKWWITAAVAKGKGREDDYGWDDVGDEVTQVLTERERSLRLAVWSPSGLAQMGGCLLAVMDSSYQVSVYAPGNDPYNSSFEEMVDLTRETMNILDPEDVSSDDGAPTLDGILEMRATSMDWSPALPLKSMLGIDGSLLAVGNRAGDVCFWSLAGGAARVHVTEIGRPWVAEMTWSAWTVVNETTCTAQLALAMTDGEIAVLPVTRKAGDDSWAVSVGSVKKIAAADRRATTSLQWLSNGALAWSKSGTVHVWTSTNGVKNVRLERVGNWAGCNGLMPCVGMQLVEPDTLIVVLSALTYHVIANAFTHPTLLPQESLQMTLSARDVFLDCARRRPRPFYSASDRELTAHTLGWVGMDTQGSVATWIAEPVNMHNLDNATEVNRLYDFVAVDMRQGNEWSVVSALGTALENPPCLLQTTPLSILTPYIMRLVGLNSNLEQDVIGTLAPPPVLPSVSLENQSDSRRALMAALWGNTALDSLRLRWVLARWGQSAHPQVEAWTAAVQNYAEAIDRALANILLAWASLTSTDTLGLVDAEFVHHLYDLADNSVTAQAGAIWAAASSVAPGSCPACGSAIGASGGSGTCGNGHEWERCSVTHLLITTPDYRVCTVCPAVAMLPRRSDGDGASTLVQVALDAAVACPSCGGRWSRPV